MTSKSTNKLLVKNTAFLYFRMILIMAVNLFAVREVLKVLGVVDYGLYNLIGGMVMMVSFLNNSMASASQRFFSIELGKDKDNDLRKMFSANIVVYFFLIIGVLILAETIGLWFVNYKLSDNIPSERMIAVNYVYQFTILSSVLTMITIPYNAAIIAHERMNIYAYVSLLEVVLKLGVVFLLFYSPYDKLVIYTILTFLVTTVISFIYVLYCRKNFAECHFVSNWERSSVKDIASYSGWNLYDSMSSVFNVQGINVLLGLFFGPVVNAARAISYQVSVTMNQFVLNFLTASRPQIIKTYASGDIRSMNELIFKTARFSFFMLFIVSVPILLKTSFVFGLWLGQVPDYVVVFTRVIIISILIDVISYPLVTCVQAHGDVKKFNLVTGSVRLLVLPISYFLYLGGANPEIAFLLNIAFSLLNLFLRLYFLKGLVAFPVGKFIYNVVLPLFAISLTIYTLLWLTNTFLKETVFISILTIGLSVIFSVIVIYAYGTNKAEKIVVTNFLVARFLKRV